MKFPRMLSLVGLACLTAACSLIGGPQSLPPLPLLPPGDLGHDLQLSQRVEVTVDGESHTFLAAWRAGPDRLDFVGLTPTGQRLLTLGYDGRQFSENYSEMLTEPLPGRDVLSHLQLAHWPLPSVRRGLESTGWRLEAAWDQRQIYLRDHLIFTIAATYPDGDGNGLPTAIRISSHVAPFELTVETLPVQHPTEQQAPEQ